MPSPISPSVLPAKSEGNICQKKHGEWFSDPEKDKALKFGDWNKMRIVVKGDNVTSYLNGVEMVNFSDPKIGEGKGGVLLQIHDGGGIKVYWRNIVLKKL